MKIACISFPGLNFLPHPGSIEGIVPKTNKMKIAILSVFAVLIFSGCTKTYVTNDPVNQVYSALYTIPASQWIPSSDASGNFYFTTITIAELTQDIDLHGGVVVYLSFDDETNQNPIYEALPEVISGVAYGALHTTGSVTIDLRGADGGDITGGITSPVLLKVVLLQAQPLD
jgi:hypothetical protein